jgi:hypothetical protein
MERLANHTHTSLFRLFIGFKETKFYDIGFRMKMIADPAARKAYTDSKSRPESNSSHVRTQNVETGNKAEEKREEEIPKWVRMVVERQEALQKAKDQVSRPQHSLTSLMTLLTSKPEICPWPLKARQICVCLHTLVCSW